MAAIDEDDRPKKKIAHEIGHLWMHDIPAAALARRPDGAHPAAQDSEAQADGFAAEFLMPADEISKTCRTADDIVRRYHVSIIAAIQRVRELQAEGLMRR